MPNIINRKQTGFRKWKVQYSEAKQLADSWGIEYMETSAKTNFNCKEAFEKLALEIIKTKTLLSEKKCCFPFCCCNII